MATATTPFSVWINVLGSVSPTVTNSLNSVNRQLKGLQTQVLATSRAMQFGFGRLLGLGLGLAGIGSVVAGMKQAIDLSLQNEQIQEATLVILRNQRQLRHENSQLAIQDLKALNEQAVSLQRQTGLYKNVFERGNLILAQSRLNLNQIESLQPVMANLLAAQRMQGKSAEDMQQTYKAIGMAIERGMGRSLSRSGVLLTPIEQRMLMMNAMVGNIAGNLKIVENAINRVYAGTAKFRMDTLTGRTEMHLADMRLSLEHMGNALKPIWQRLVGISARLISAVEPVIIRLADLIGGALKDNMKNIAGWIDLLRTKGIPTMVDWINKGWAKLIEAQKWLNQNQDWIQAWIRNLSILGMIVQAEWKRFMIVINWAKPAIAYIVELFKNLGLQIDAAHRKLRTLRGMFTGLSDFLFGTSRYNYQPWKEKFAPGRAHRIERALPFGGTREGLVGGWLDELSRLIDKWWLKFTRWVNKAFNQLRDGIIRWFGQMWDWIRGQVDVWVPEIEKAIGRIGKAIDQFLLHPMQVINNLWEKFLKFMGIAQQNVDPTLVNAYSSPNIYGGDVGGGGKGGHVYNPLGPAPSYTGGGASGLKALNFGPLSDPTSAGGAYWSDYGSGPLKPGSSHLHALMPWDIAMSPGLLGRGGPYHMGQWGSIVDASGKPVPGLGHVKIADTSWINKNTPTYNTFEQRKYLDMKGRYKFVPDTTSSSTGPPVTINYTVHHHHEGGADLENRLAAIHRRHIDQLSRHMEEVAYRRNRSAFDGARAV